jgi:hypothetical protein
LTRRRNQQDISIGHVLRPLRRHHLPRHRDGTHQNLSKADDPETYSHQHGITVTHPSSFPSKRGPSRSPSPANQIARTQHVTFRRSVSSPQLARTPSKSQLPELRAPLPSPRTGLFSHYRESQIGSPSVSSRTSSRSARDHVDGGRSGLSSASSSRQALLQASPGPVYSRMPQHSEGGIGALSATQDPMIQRRNALRASHQANDSWYQLYETLEIGTLPSPEQCANAPPSQKLLATIPNLKSSRKTSTLGHFYSSHSETEFQCKVKDDSGLPCGKIFKKSGGSRTRLNHVTSAHPELYDALREFRTYQFGVQAIELPLESEEIDTPATPKKSRFETVRDEFIISNMKQPLAFEQQTFVDLLLKLVTVRGAPFALIDSEEFRALCGLLNPLYTVPSTASLQRSLDSSVRNNRQKIQEYIHHNVVHGSITADSWTAIDRRKYLGITYHLLTPTFKLASVVIGMERIVGPQTSDTLFKAICKLYTFSVDALG